MILCAYTLKVEIPDDWPPRIQLRALEAIDTNEIPAQIKLRADTIINSYPSIRGAYTTVED